jgi:hypothetical protein
LRTEIGFHDVTKNSGTVLRLEIAHERGRAHTFSGSMMTQNTLIRFAVEIPQVRLKATSDDLESLPRAALKSFTATAILGSKMAHDQEASGFSQVFNRRRLHNPARFPAVWCLN